MKTMKPIITALAPVFALVFSLMMGFETRAEYTILHDEIVRGDTSAALRLINKGQYIHEKNDRGLTPLHYAAWHGSTEITQALIAAGADVNAKGEDGQTPLHSAAIGWSNIETAEMLINAGADVNAKIEKGDNASATPLDIAVSKDKTETADVIRAAGGKCNKSC